MRLELSEPDMSLDRKRKEPCFLACGEVQKGERDPLYLLLLQLLQTDIHTCNHSTCH